MIIKKTLEADIHRKKFLFFNIGLICALLLITVAFTWKSYQKKIYIDSSLVDLVDDTEIIINTKMEKPKPEKKKIAKIITVEDEVKKDDFDPSLFDDLSDPDAEIDDEFVEEFQEEQADEIFLRVEQQPVPKGGFEAFYKFVSQNLKYPAQARRIGIEGKVFIQFIVDKTGELTDIKVVRGIAGGCNEAALNVVGKAPNWNPGKQRGEPVKVRMVIPINFRLN